jgi:PAS domain S-box-containing protein
MSQPLALDHPIIALGSFGVRRYAIAAFSVLAGIGVQTALYPSPSQVIPLLVSLLAVIATAYMTGRGPALFATGANLLVNCYFFAEPHFSFAVAKPADRESLIAFVCVGSGVSLLSHRFSRARHFPRVAMMLASSLFLVVVALLVWFDFANAREAERQVEHTYQVLNASQDLFSTIQDAELRQRNYLLTGDEQNIASFHAALASEASARRQLGGLTVDNASQKTRLAELDRLIQTRLALLEDGVVLRRRQGAPAAIETVRTGQGARVMDQIRTILGNVQADEHDLLSQRSLAAAAEATRTRGALATGTALLVALLIFAGIAIESDVGKLQTSEKMLRRQADLLEQVREPIIVWELGGPIEYWNRGAEELYGFSRQQAVGREHNALLHPTHPLGMPAIQELLGRDGQWSGELAYLIGTREIIVESRMTLITEPDGHRTVIKANRDITEQKHAQEEIRQLNRELEQRVKDRTTQLEASNQELEAFAYSVSHDLRAPLRGIDGWSMALLEDYGPKLDGHGQQYLQRVRMETQRMGCLIDDLLKLSRLSRVEIQRESVDLTSLAHAIAARLSEAEPMRNLEFVIQDGLLSGGDAHLLEIVLSNLLSNAAKFTGPRPVARIEFGQTKRGGELAFYVRDNGVGFDMVHAGNLFGAFQRLHKYTEFPGTGIGLATAQRVLRRHGGRIWADARPREGATFYFTIGPTFLWDRHAPA